MKNRVILLASVFTLLGVAAGQRVQIALVPPSAELERTQALESELQRPREENERLRAEIDRLRKAVQQQTGQSPGSDSQVLNQVEPQKKTGAQQIPCPLAQARTEITTPLPDPWWNTPQVG